MSRILLSRSERDGGKSLPVEQRRFGIHIPGVTDHGRLGHVGRANDNLIAINRCRGPVELPIAARHLEAGDLISACLQATVRMVEAKAQGSAVAPHRAESGASIGKILAVGYVKRG